MNGFFQWAVSMAKRTLVKDGFHTSMFLFRSGRDIRVMALQYDTDFQKLKALKTIRNYIQQEDIGEYVVISEGWALRGSKKDITDSKGHFLRPSENPHREECLTIGHITKDKKESVMIPFKRTESNKIVFCEEEHFVNECEGLFMDLFVRER